MYDVTSTALVSLTLATFLNAEFGFFGVCVLTWRHTPLLCGQALSAGDLLLFLNWLLPNLIS
jgi:hypothetical protein